MKIVHLLGWYLPDTVGGTELYVEGLCRRLRAAGQDVLVAAPTARGKAGTYQHDGVSVFRYTIPEAPTRDEALQRTPVRGAGAFHAWLAVQKPDVLHVHSFTTGVGLPEIREARRLGIRVIATCHLPGLGYMCRTGELMQWGTTPCDGVVHADKCASCSLTRLGMPKPLARAIGAMPTGASRAASKLPGRAGTALGMPASVVEYGALQRELFDLVETFVVLNETARCMLAANGSPDSKLVINKLGLSQTSYAPKPGPASQPTSRPVRFGYVGRLHPTKGLVELVRAARSVPREIPYVLEIRGPQLDGATRAFVDRLRALAGSDDRVRFDAGVEPADIPLALSPLDVLLCPSVCFENGPTVALEANAVGTPVIASRVGNLTELVVDGVNGRLVAAGDIAAWSRALMDTARHPDVTIDRWRQQLLPPRTMDDVARDYLTLYSA